MIVIGLTGSIAMGKSTVGDMLRDAGVPVHESDHEVHALLQRDAKGYEAVKTAFPQSQYPDLYAQDQTLDRAALGKLVFHDDDLRKTLEGILHPLVQGGQQDFIAAHAHHDVVCLDIPLLFEVGAEARVDYTLTVSAPYDVQRARALSRPHMTEEKFAAILERQMPDAKKRACSDYVVDTGGDYAQTRQALDAVLLDIRTKSGLIEIS